MTWGVLFGLPVRLLVFLTETALIIVSNLRDESIVDLLSLETTSEVHRSDLLGFEDAREYIFVHPIPECYKNPVGGKVVAPTFLAHLAVELDWVKLEIGCRLMARSIITAALCE